jgi:hypothetical protein
MKAPVNLIRSASLCGAAGLLGMLMLIVAGTADARDRPGRQRTHDVKVQRTGNGHTRQDTWSNDKGKTATRDATVVNDRDSKTRTRDVVYTGPNGKQVTREDVTQKTDSGYTRDTTVTGPNGKTATRNVEVERDTAAGTRTKNVTVTGPNGQTRSVSDAVQKTDSGYTRETDLTRANGSTTSRSVEATYDPVTKTWSKTVDVEHTPKP